MKCLIVEVNDEIIAEEVIKLLKTKQNALEYFNINPSLETFIKRIVDKCDYSRTINFDSISDLRYYCECFDYTPLPSLFKKIIVKDVGLCDVIDLL